MIRKLKTGDYRLYSGKLDPRTGRRRNLGTFKTRADAEKHERAVHILQASSLVRWQETMPKKSTKKRWVKHVKTDSTSPPPGTFKGSARQIVKTMARKDVSPKGPGSGVKMIQYYINRAGKNLSASRRRELERAKKLLQERS